MSQAKDRIVNAGYTSVTDLSQDAKGVWHGKAMKGGATASVMVDYQGNVTAQ